MLAPVITFTSIDEYLEAEFASRERHEYINGKIAPMSYASENHELIIANLIRLIGNHLVDTNCRVYPSNRMLHIPECQRFYYPDMMVVCGDSQFFEYKTKMKATLNPQVIVEVLSDSTEKIDRSEKWRCYQKITSLQQYLLISQHDAYIEQFVRLKEAPSKWLNSRAEGIDASIDIGGHAIALNDIYKHVNFE